MMTFEERRTSALDKVTDFLEGMSPPRGMSEKAQDKVMLSIADALARKLATGTQVQFFEDLDKTFATVSDNHKTWAWPSQGEFVAAIPARARNMAPAPKTFSPESPHAAIAKRMRTNQPVAESSICGRVSEQMLNSRDVARDIMDRYRRGSIKAARSAYGDDAEKMLRDRYGDVVNPYFRTREPAHANEF